MLIGYVIPEYVKVYECFVSAKEIIVFYQKKNAIQNKLFQTNLANYRLPQVSDEKYPQYPSYNNLNDFEQNQ